MLLFMNSQSCSTIEHFPAYNTGPGIMSRVYFDMSCEGGFDCESSRAVRTLVWLVVGVNPDVSQEITRLLKLLGAKVTEKQFCGHVGKFFFVSNTDQVFSHFAVRGFVCQDYVAAMAFNHGFLVMGSSGLLFGG